MIYSQITDERLKIPDSIKVTLEIGHWRLGIGLLSIQNNSIICLRDHQTIDCQCAITNVALPRVDGLCVCWGGGGASCVARLNFKTSHVSVYKINDSRRCWKFNENSLS